MADDTVHPNGIPPLLRAVVPEGTVLLAFTPHVLTPAKRAAVQAWLAAQYGIELPKQAP